MTDRVIVLGAGGRFGRSAVSAFLEAGWEVTALVRNPEKSKLPAGVNCRKGDVLNLKSLQEACDGMDVIVNTVNPSYELWQSQLPTITQNVISAAQSSDATVVIPGNIYNYGEMMPPILTETTPHVAKTKKGKLRIDMEEAYQNAASTGVRTIILRSGDYIEREKTGNWFDTHIASKALQGKFSYPGATNQVHAWAYLPDKARALVQIVEKRAELEPFEEFVFEGVSLTGEELRQAVEIATAKEQKHSVFPWPMVKLIALFSPRIKEVLELRYLWNTPHQVDGSKLKKFIPEFRQTPLDSALNEVFRNQRNPT